MRTAAFRARLARGDKVIGTFVKIPEISVIEVLAQAGLDFICLDAEHAAFDRGRLDACLAMARALDLPALVRIGGPNAPTILQALDSGAVGVVVPHVNSAETAAGIVAAAHFGAGGRGFAASTRWAGFASRPMSEVLDRDAETVVVAQIEDPEGLESVEAIAAVPGIDALFAGPADLSVGFGQRSLGSPQMLEALERIGAACRAHGKTYASWVPDIDRARDWASYGISLFLVGSDHGFLRAGAAGLALRLQP
ncbi:MAG: aldolase [Rubellimicrobium sp.]|nr:aldolase [Rubellimicrobium sp.]